MDATCEAAWNTDELAMQRRVAKLLADAQSAAANARLQMSVATAAAQAVGGPLAATAAAKLFSGKVASADGEVADLKQRIAKLKEAGSAAHAEAAGKRGEVRGYITSECEPGKSTPQNFVHKAAQFAKASASIKQLNSEMHERATNASWVSAAGSSEMYEQCVPAQMAALSDLSKVSANNSMVCLGIALLQRAVYQAHAASLRAAKQMVCDAASQASALAEQNAFFHGTKTAQANLAAFMGWTAGEGRAGLNKGSFRLTDQLVDGMKSATTLQGGWPDRLNGSDAAGSNAFLAELAQTLGQAMAGMYSIKEMTGTQGDSIAL